MYRLGNITLAVGGQSPMADRLAELLASLRIDEPSNSPADLSIEFVPSLGDWSGGGSASLDGFQVGPDRYRVGDRVWRYEVSGSNGAIHVAIAPRRRGPLADLGKRISKSWRYLLTHGRGGYLHELKRAVFYVYLPLAELAMIGHGSTFVHCAAVERDGQAILFPATGGVGKTSILGKFIAAGYRFLSDDLSIINADGTVSAHPLPMHVYKFHETHSPELAGRMVRQMTRWDRMLWRTLGLIKRPDKLVRWVPPQQVVGQESMSPGGRIKAVVHLQRQSGIDQLTVRPAPPEELADLMASTLLNEVTTLPKTSIKVRSCQAVPFVPTLGELQGKISSACRSALAGADCRAVCVPPKASIDALYDFILDSVRP